MGKKYRREPKKGRNTVKYRCDNCGKLFWETPSHFRRNKRHFCSMKCYGEYRSKKMRPEEQPNWQGGR